MHNEWPYNPCIIDRKIVFLDGFILSQMAIMPKQAN